MNHDLALTLKMLPSLAFEKKEKTRNSYDMIVQENQLCLYFGSTYIKNLVPNRETLFPPSLWNQRDAAVSGISRTTIAAVEGWHFGIQSYFSGAHPNKWNVVISL